MEGVAGNALPRRNRGGPHSNGPNIRVNNQRSVAFAFEAIGTQKSLVESTVVAKVEYDTA